MSILRRTVAYVTLALLAVTILGGGLMVALGWLGRYQIRSALAELGLTVTIEADHADVKANSHVSAKQFVASAPFLARLNAVAPIRSIDLSKTDVTNLEPLKGLTALTTLDLSGTPVVDLEPLEGLTGLTTLSLLHTPVTNLEPLKALTGYHVALPLQDAGHEPGATDGPD